MMDHLPSKTSKLSTADKKRVTEKATGRGTNNTFEFPFNYFGKMINDDIRIDGTSNNFIKAAIKNHKKSAGKSSGSNKRSGFVPTTRL